MDDLDRWKSNLPLVLGAYPIFIGLYAAGLFWDVPSDIVGAFGFDEFIVKASILYSLAMAAILVPLLLASSVYAVVLSDDDRASAENNQTEKSTAIKWATATTSEKVRVSLASIGLMLLAVYSLYRDPMPLRMNPDGFLTWLLLIGLAGFLARPFLNEIRWKAAQYLYFSSWIVAVPVLAGYADAKPKPDAPAVKIGSVKCPVVMVGKDVLVASCKAAFVLIKRSDNNAMLIWKKLER